MASLTSLRANVWYPTDMAEPPAVRPETMTAMVSHLAACAPLRTLYLWNINLQVQLGACWAPAAAGGMLLLLRACCCWWHAAAAGSMLLLVACCCCCWAPAAAAACGCRGVKGCCCGGRSVPCLPAPCALTAPPAALPQADNSLLALSQLTQLDCLGIDAQVGALGCLLEYHLRYLVLGPPLECFAAVSCTTWPAGLLQSFPPAGMCAFLAPAASCRRCSRPRARTPHPTFTPTPSQQAIMTPSSVLAPLLAPLSGLTSLVLKNLWGMPGGIDAQLAGALARLSGLASLHMCGPAVALGRQLVGALTQLTALTRLEVGRS
jgi:hypothetical protein